MSIGNWGNLAHAQGVIINELSNGTSGTKEFVELLVIGDPANPTALVDLSGWIIDDNNGDFEGVGSGRGIATGHLRFASNCFTGVMPGTLIVIYNASAPNDNLPPADTFDLDGNCIYVMPSTSMCLESCSSQPSTSTGLYAGCSYGPGVFGRMGFRNGGDAVQVRTPAAAFFHGFSYGDVGAPFPNFPAGIGGATAFNVGTGSAGGDAFAFGCGDFTNAGNYSRIAASADTPGAPNSPQNRYVMNALRTGTYDYANLAAAGNCGSSSTLGSCSTLLPFRSESLKARQQGMRVGLTWEFEGNLFQNGHFEVQRSHDAVNFLPIGTVAYDPEQSSFAAVDWQPEAANYYRLRMVDQSGASEYSNVVFLTLDETPNVISVRPNPNQGQLHLELFQHDFGEAPLQMRLYDVRGQLVDQKALQTGAGELDWEFPAALANGMYLLEIRQAGRMLQREKIILRRE